MALEMPGIQSEVPNSRVTKMGIRNHWLPRRHKSELGIEYLGQLKVAWNKLLIGWSATNTSLVSFKPLSKLCPLLLQKHHDREQSVNF